MGKYRNTDDGVVQGVAYVKTGFLGLRRKKVLVELKNGGLLTVHDEHAANASLQKRNSSGNKPSASAQAGPAECAEDDAKHMPREVSRNSGKNSFAGISARALSGTMSRNASKNASSYNAEAGGENSAQDASLNFEKSLSLTEYRVRESAGSLVVKVEGRSLSFAVDQNSAEDLQRLSGSLRKAGAQKMSEFYTLNELIGHGAYAKVYAGEEKKTGERVAVKLLLKKKSSPGVTESINNEVEVLRMLDDHPHIVRVLDVFETEYEARIILEYMNYGTLFDLMMRSPKRRLKEGASLFLVAQVLRGLVYLHGKRIVHGDIKAENVLLSNPAAAEDGDAEKKRVAADAMLDAHAGVSRILVAKIADFGLSASLDNVEQGSISGKTGRGTPEYMAPELLAAEQRSAQGGGSGRRGLGVDVWACGVLLYVLVSGQYPFHGATPEETRRHVADGRLVFPSVTFSHVSAATIAVIRRLLTRDPTARPSAEEILADPTFANTPTPLASMECLPAVEQGAVAANTATAATAASAQTGSALARGLKKVGLR